MAMRAEAWFVMARAKLKKETSMNEKAKQILRAAWVVVVLAVIVCAFQTPASQRKEKPKMSENTAFGLSKIRQIAITVQELDRAVAFYRDQLGMKHLFTVPRMAFFDCDGIRVMLGLPEQGERHSSIIYFDVDDIQKAFQALSERGIQFSGKPHLIAKLETVDVWLTEFRDSENTVLALMSEVPRK
jgi:methylmalonyl-CoA/ethylmalonyl-CoA epimerase